MIALIRRALKRSEAIMEAGKAPQDSAEHDVLSATNVSIPDRHALLDTLKGIRALPEAIGRSEHENGRLL